MKSNRELAAILFSDVSDFTSTMDSNENMAMGQILRHKEIVSSALKEYNGHLIKDLGDGLYVKFPSAVDSVQCAIRIQQLTKSENFSIRIGIHLGDVITKDSDVFGSGVNIASRIHTSSDPGSICISKEIWKQVKNQNDIQANSLGMKAFKGVEEKIEVYELSNDKSIKRDPVQSKNIYTSMKNILFPMTGLILTIIGGIFWLAYSFFDIGYTKPSYSTSIAILELKNIGAKTNSFFAEGLSEAIITNLTKIKNLKVIPRTDIERLKTDWSIKKIAKELNVEYIVEGSVNIDEPYLRVTARLINPFVDKNIIWSETYNNSLSHILIVQDSISHQIVSALKQKITKDPLLDDHIGGIRPGERKIYNRLDAVEFVSMAYVGLLNSKYSRTENAKYIEQFLKKAFQADCTYAEIYAAKALTILIALADLTDPLKDNERIEEVKKNIDVALEYDKNNVLALAEQDMLATINMFKHDKDYQNLRWGRGILNEMIDRLIMSVSNSNYNR